jgi:hypothetical protein
MRITGNIIITGKEVGGSADIKLDITMSANPPHKVVGYMVINGTKVDIDATNVPMLTGYISVTGKKLPVGIFA